MRVYGLDPNELDMERWQALLDRMADVLESENPIDPHSEPGAERMKRQMERGIRRKRQLEAEYGDEAGN